MTFVSSAGERSGLVGGLLVSLVLGGDGPDMSTDEVLMVAVGWVLFGLAVGLWMARRGHDPRWAVIAVAFGPIFVPIAFERVERRPRLVVPGPASPGQEAEAADGPRVLIGLDGSVEAQAALDRANDLLGSHLGLLVLAEVVCHDATEDASYADIDAATHRLRSSAARVRGVGGQVGFAVLAGPPGEALLWFAEDRGMDLIVVGRRGRGLSTRLLGSVSSWLVRHSRLPVLVVESRSQAGRARWQRQRSGGARRGRLG